MLQTVTRPRGRPKVGEHPLADAERKARSRAARQIVQLNVEVPAPVRQAVRKLAAATDRTQAEVLAAAIEEYLARYSTRPTRPAVDDRPLALASAIVKAAKRGPAPAR